MRSELIVPREGGAWWGTADHRDFLLDDARRQLEFFRTSIDVAGGFHSQDLAGKPIAGAPRELHATTRMVHSYAIGMLAGFDGGEDVIDHGVATLLKHHRDARHGGYVWSFDRSGEVIDGNKLAYGHAFVLLAAASAKMVDHPDADRLLGDVVEVIDAHFWDHSLSRMKEEYARDWQPISSYRGMNANMHSAEAFLAAAEATGDMSFAQRARSIFNFFVGDIGAAHGWRLPEHFDESWRVDPHFEGDPMFRPKGATPGHAFEFARLLLQLRDLQDTEESELFDWARNLYATALAEGWDHRRGGIVYTVDPATGKSLRDARYWWPVTEAIGAAAAMIKSGEDCKEDYRMFWQAAEQLFIDKERGGWLPEVDDKGKPDSAQFAGKPDIYHSLQATLYPLMPGLTSFKQGLSCIKTS
jgi:sulfoquinovose isomerase